MDSSTQFQTNKPLESNLQTNVVRKAQQQNLISTTGSIGGSISTINSLTNVKSAISTDSCNETIPPLRSINVTTNNLSNSTVSNLIASTVSNGQPNAPQQIIQVSSQAGGTIMSGQQLMVQTLSGRPAIQLRTAQAGQQFQQFQLIPFSNLPGQNQRPVIIQQTPGNVIHSASTITSVANLNNLTHNNVAKITSVANALPNSANLTHQKPVIIQQSSAGQFIHSNNQSHNLHGHNVTKIATVGRANAQTSRTGTVTGATNQTGKMVLGHLTTTNHHHTNASVNSLVNHHQTQQNHHLTNNATANQVTRLNIISSLPTGVHTSVSNVQQHGTAGKPILSLATATLNKPLIINPASSVVQPSIVQPSIVGNVVNMSNFNATASHQLKQSNTGNLIPTVMTLTTLTTSSGSIPSRHAMITSTTTHSQPYQQQQQTLTNSQQPQRLTVSSSSIPNNSNNSQLIINSSSAASNLIQQVSSISSNLPSQQSNIRSNLLTSSSASNTLNSPIKQLPQGTPSSPRPSILIRKRVGTPLDQDSKPNYQSSSINSKSANNSQLNSVKQNLSLKYNNLSSTIQPNHTSNVLSGLKNEQSKQPINQMNLKKQNLDSSQLKKNENEIVKLNDLVSTTANDCGSLMNSTTATNNQLMNNTNFNNNNNLNNVDNRQQITPRKRRKQLLEPFMLTTSQNIKLLNDDSNNLLCNEESLKKKDSYSTNSINYQSTSTVCRRPRPSLLSSYNLTWKSLQYHFLRHTEVKIKSEKKINLTELTNETLKKRNGWKINHLSSQLEDLLENEISSNQKLKHLSKLYSENKNQLPPKIKELGNQPFNAKVRHNSISILDKLNDLFAANIQRSNLIHDQIKDTNSILNKMSTDHKDKVNKMTKRLMNKRNPSLKV